MSWVFYILIANILIAATQIFDKYFNSKKIKNVYSYIVLLNAGAVIFVLSVSYIIRDSFVLNSSFFWAALSGGFYFVMWLLFWQALQTGEVSRVIALFFTQPVFNAFLAVLILGESISLFKWIAILFIVVGGYIVTKEKKSEQTNRIYIPLTLLAAVVSASGNIVSKYAMTGLPPITVNAIGYLSTMPISLILLANKEVFREVRANFTKLKDILAFLIRGLTGYVATCFFAFAIGSGLVSTVVAMSGTQPLFTLTFSLLTSFFLPKLIKENISKEAIFTKASAVAMIVVGAIMISL